MAGSVSSVLRWTGVLVLLMAFVLVPFALLDARAQTLVAEALAAARTWPRIGVGAFIAAVLALDIPLPIPSSIVSTASGSLLGFVGGTVASTLGMTFGCALGYALGRGGRPWLGMTLLSDEQLARAEALSARYGRAALIVARPIPVLAEISVIFAGLSRLELRSFAWITTLANLGISAVYAGAGARAHATEQFGWAVAAAIFLPGIAMLVGRRLPRERPESPSGPENPPHE